MNALTLPLLTLLLLAITTAARPLFKPLTDPDAAERARLEAQYSELTAKLSALSDEHDRPALEERAARLLRRLDALPPAPKGAPRGLMLGALLGALLLVGVGTYTFIPRWQLAALSSNEQLAVQKALKLPALQRATAQQRSPEAYLAWADAAFEAGAFPQAAQGYAEALKLNPRQPRALRRLGMLLISGQSGRTLERKEALQAFMLVRAAAQQAPNDPESQLYLGLALNSFGEDELALSALERYQKLAPEQHEADDLLATLRSKVGQSTRAEAVFAGNCASCHGQSGRGSSGPNLHVSRLSRNELREVIVHGKNSMPAFPQLPAADLTALLNQLEAWQK